MSAHARADVTEDTTFLLSFGESPAHITRRLDMKPAAVAQALHRSGETQRARGFWAEDRRTRKTRPVPSHRAGPVLIFGPDLELTYCICGRLFDAAGITRHIRSAS